MDTCFAPAQRASEKIVANEIETVSQSPVVSGLLHSISGLLAVLDEHRQIVALNDSFLRALGIDDPAGVLGLRPGEVLQCVYAHDEPAGCGTTKQCSTCGAAIAIVSSLESNNPIEKMCALKVQKDDRTVDMALLVKSHPIQIDDARFLLLYLQDITQQQKQAALEKTFFHDVNNLLSMLFGASEMLVMDQPSDLATTIHQASQRLVKEVEIQRFLMQNNSTEYQPIWQVCSTQQIVEELQAFCNNHPAARGKTFDIVAPYPRLSITTDRSLLLRVLCNMVINALEATTENSRVKIWLEHDDQFLSFSVWNQEEIPEDISHRIFQRNFSTKEKYGRGIGTFSMKLFGESILGGHVTFTSSRDEGTTFRISLPL